MRIAVVSDARLPTLPDGSHGLGRSAYDIAYGLTWYADFVVTLFAGKGSRFGAGELVVYDSESLLYDQHGYLLKHFDAILDTSHTHALSMFHSHLPILNRIADRECKWQPPNSVVNSAYMRDFHPTAKIVDTGVDIDLIPFHLKPTGGLAYMSGRHLHKGIGDAIEIAKKLRRKIDIIENVVGTEKWNRLGNESVLLHPSTIDAAPRLPLEAAACGVPTLCYNRDGAEQHVAHGVSGFVCLDIEDMALSVATAENLDRRSVLDWVVKTHSFSAMIGQYSSLLATVANGGTW